MTSPGFPADDALARILLDSIQDEAVFALDAAGVVVSWNSGAERITGYTAEEARGKHVSLFYPDDEVQLGAPGRELRRAERDGSVEVEGWWVRKDGTRLWISASTRALRGADGQVAGYARVGRDVTERLRAEEALRLSEARFSGIVSIASDAIVSVDESQRIVLFNQGAEQIFGYTAREAIGQPLDLLIPHRSRASHHGHLAGFGAGRGHAARRMGERQEIFGLRKGGEEFPAEASISRLEVGGRMLFTAVLRDVTERKRTERRIAELLAAEQTARAAAEAAERRTRVLAEAGSLLTASLDYATTLRTLARLAVPTLADGCTVYLKDHDGAVRLFELGMEDADTAARVSDIRSGPIAGALHPALKVVTTGRSVLVDPVPDELLAGLSESGPELNLLRELDPRTLMVVPIALRGEAMGALGFVTMGDRPGFTRADVELAEELGRRAGLAIENARLYRAAQ
ncbi:MAG TPA: PAS domain S-box protein, partial [Longimicrobium sp.]|nr:PAS domain S-box protein [Longimicrobium sp.]